MRHRYFAYGSNMDQGQMAARCPSARSIGVAQLRGHQFRINLRGVATIVPDPTATVWGLLWVLTSDDLTRLDEYEGVREGWYQRHICSVVGPDGAVEALVYVATDDRPGVPRREYFERILAAARTLQLPPDYVAEVEASGRNSSREA